MVAAVLASLTFSASAHASEPGEFLEGKSPYTVWNGYSCAEDSGDSEYPAEIIGYDTVWGVVKKHHSFWCKTDWATVNFGGKLTSTEYGNAHIRTNRGIDYTCDRAGGNGRVVTGQQTCYTPMTFPAPGEEYWAEGYQYLKNSKGAWYMAGFGKTPTWIAG